MTASRQRLPHWLMLVGAMTAVGPVSIDMYLPGFPSIEREFAARGVEGTMAAFMIGLAVGQLVYGPISDRFGRKPPLYVGLIVYTLGSLGCALSVNMTMLIVMRIVQALGGCAGMVIGRAIVRDRCEPHEAARAFTTLMLIVALGPVLAPAVGDVANVTAISIPNVIRNYVQLARDRHFIAYSLLLGFSMASMFSYVTGAPRVITENYGLSSQQFGWLIGLNGLMFMSASLLNMRALRTLEPRQVLARYVWASPVLGIVLLLSSSLLKMPLWAVVPLQLAFFLGVGRVNPNVSALALAPHGRNAGTASALMGATQSALTTCGGLAVAIFNDGTVRTLAAIMTSGAVLAVLCYLWARRVDP